MAEFCGKCMKKVPFPCGAANDNESNRNRVVAACADELMSRPRYWRMAIALANLMDERTYSRRDILDWLAVTIFFYDGRIMNADGTLFDIPDTLIDDVFEPSGRWISGFRKFAVEKPRQAPRVDILDKLQIIDLAFQIAYPQIARHFSA